MNTNKKDEMKSENESNGGELPELATASCSRLLDYERLIEATTISKAICTFPGESVLIRNAFRWKRNGEVVSNAYESHTMEQVCEDRGWKIVARYGEHIAIISENVEGRHAEDEQQ